LSRDHSIDALREQIDRIDDQLITLLNRRAKVVTRVAESKRKTNQAFFRPAREKRVYQRVEELNKGPLRREDMRSIYREIIAACLALEQPLRIACLGPAGTFSYQAVCEQFGDRAAPVTVTSIAEVFDEVEHRRVDYGVVPVENSTEGVVAATLDRFVSSNLRVKAEILLRIDQCLMSKSGRSDRVKRIVSHPQSLGQCRQWLTQHFPRIPLEEVGSNAQAAEVARRDVKAAAIAGRIAAEHYGLKVVAENIQDQSENLTRFFVIAHDGEGRPSGEDKTSLLVSVSHESGALYHVLKPFSDHGVNLCSIESRPLKGRPWEYVFFLDLDGHSTDKQVIGALEAVRKRSLFLKVLGSYPSALRPL
jgi:chorismate mutase/prephenate dehydratase